MCSADLYLRKRIDEPSLGYANCFSGLIYEFLNKHFSEIMCSFIDNISSKHDPEATAPKLNVLLFALIHASLL